MPSKPATTTETAPDAVVAVTALGRALDALVAALASGSPSELFATEAALASALSSVSRIGSIASCDQARLRAELAHARATLERCRRVGTTLSGIVDGCLAVGGRVFAYDKSGKHTRF